MMKLGLAATALAFAGTSSAAETQYYTYDAHGRLLKAYTMGASNDGNLRAQEYDRVGNRSSYRATKVTLGLAPDQILQSTDGRFVLTMQGDGNLVLYFGTQALWVAPNAYGTRNTTWFQGDGNLVIYNPSGAPLRASGIYSPGAELTLQNDGNLMIRVMDGSIIWNTGTGGH